MSDKKFKQRSDKRFRFIEEVQEETPKATFDLIGRPTTKPNAFIKEEPKKDITPNEFIASVEANKKRIEELRQDYDSYNKEMSSPEAITEALTSPDFPLIGNTGNSVVRLLSAIGSNEENKLRKYGEIAASGLNLGIGVIPPMALISAASPFAKGVTRPIGDAVGLKRTTTDFLTEMGLAAPLGLPVVGGMLGAHGVGEGTKAALKSYTDLPEKDIDLASELAGHLGFFGGMPVGKKVGKGLDKTKKKLDDVVKKDIDKLFGETTLTKSLDGDYVDVSRRTGRTSKPIEKIKAIPKDPKARFEYNQQKQTLDNIEKRVNSKIERGERVDPRILTSRLDKVPKAEAEALYNKILEHNNKIKKPESKEFVLPKEGVGAEKLTDLPDKPIGVKETPPIKPQERVEVKPKEPIVEVPKTEPVAETTPKATEIKAEPVKEIKDNTNYIQSLKESIHSRLQWNKNDTGTQKRKYLKEARDLATKLRQEGVNAKIERAKKGWKLYIDNKPQGKRELGLIERGETVKAKDVEITTPEASKPFKELPKEVRDRQEIISEMFVEANDLPKGIGQKQLEKGVKDIKDNAGKEQSPEAKIVRDVAETIIKEGKEIKIGKGSSKTEFIEPSEIKRVIDEAIERKSIIDESGDTSFNFGANVGEFKLTEPKTPTTKKKPNEQIEMEGLGGRKFPDKPITGKGKGEETTPLFEPTTETKGQIKMFEPTKEGIKPEAPKGSNAVKVEFESGKKAELLLKDADTLQGIKDPIKKIDYGKVEFTKDGKVKWDSFSEIIKDSDRIIKSTQLEQARKNIISKGQQLSAGLDPTILKDYSVIGAYHLETLLRKGIKTKLFDEWSREIVKDLGDNVKPHLVNIWNEANKVEGIQDLKMRGFGKRVAEMEQFKDIKDEIKGSKESYYKEQKQKPLIEEFSNMPDAELNARFKGFIEKAQEIDNTGVIAGLEIINRKIKAGESPIETIQQLNKVGTPLGQIISQFAILKGAKSETLYAILESKMAEKWDTTPNNLTDRTKSLLKERVDEYTRQNKKALEFEKALDKEPTLENLQKLRDLRKEVAGSEGKLAQFINRNIPHSIADTWIAAIKGSLLPLTSLTKNPYWNLFGEFFPKQLNNLWVAPIDYTVSKITGKPRTHYIDGRYYVETAKGLWEGVKQAKDIMLSGNDRFLNEKYEITRSFQPFRALVDLFSKELPANVPLKKSLHYRFGKLLEGTIGMYPTAIFRGLPFGDLPFRVSRERAVTYEMSKLKGEKGEFELFLERPDAKTKTLREYEGERAVFMQSNLISNYLLDFSKKMGDKPYGAMAKLLLTANMPYVKVPTNALFLMADYSLPIIPLAKSVHFGNLAKKGGDMAEFYRRQSYAELGKAITGMTMWAVSDMLVSNNIASGEISTEPKVRGIEYTTKPSRSINLTRLEAYLKGEKLPKTWGKDDLIVDYETLGGMGTTLMIMDEYNKKYRYDDTSTLNKFLNLSTTAVFGGAKFLANQSIAQGIQGFLGALLSNDEKKRERWFNNMADVVSAPLLPSQLAANNRMIQDYIIDRKGDSFGETFLNSVELKNPFKTPENPRYIRDIWGRPVKRPEGVGALQNIFYFFKARTLEDDPVTYEIYDIYTRTEDKGVIPPQVSSSFTRDNKTIKLNKSQHEKLQQYIGEERLTMAKKFLQSDNYLIRSDEYKIKKFEKIYIDGYNRGKDKFIRELLAK